MKIIHTFFWGLIALATPISAHAVAGIDLPNAADMYADEDDTVSVEELLEIPQTDTKCATAAMADGLARNQTKISAESTEEEVKAWIAAELMSADVLRAVLACPEIAGADEMETIRFLPIEYTTPGGQHIVINYEAQPKLLKQRLMLANKQAMTGDDSGGIGGDGAIWVNTDPSWYAIMVTQTGALDEFVGNDKNNIISLKNIYDNIDNMYPSGWFCTDRSALANDEGEINLATKKTIGLGDEDTNDYYVAGDINLSWISYAEIALDVALTVLTFGASASASVAIKSVKATKTLRNLETTIKNLRKLEKVQDYRRLETKLAQANRAREAAQKAGDANAVLKHEKEIKKLGKGMREMEKADDNVKKYKEATESFSEINQWRRNLRALGRIKQHGNVLARPFRATKAVFKTLKASRGGAKAIKQGSKIARSSMKSGKLRDWLYHSTRATASAASKGVADATFLYGAIKFVGDWYDYTATSTDEYTSGLDFKPLLLLSADDIPGQDNVVNYGMWLMWSGNSIDQADDDAAFLQAMDFAEKFWVDLTELQEQTGRHDCNIDIYVVHPVIRNPNTDSAELYYLIMNDIPWTTANDQESK